MKRKEITGIFQSLTIFHETHIRVLKLAFSRIIRWDYIRKNSDDDFKYFLRSEKSPLNLNTFDPETKHFDEYFIKHVF